MRLCWLKNQDLKSAHGTYSESIIIFVKLADRDIVISRIDTSDNLVDPFTRALLQAKLDAHRYSIGIRDVEDLI